MAGPNDETPDSPAADIPTIAASRSSAGVPLPVLVAPCVLPERIGPYRVIALLGEGGMGTVYEAEQEHPRRRVALKVVRGGQFVDAHHVRLFQREVQTLARLLHPNIAAIYEAGPHRGRRALLCHGAGPRPHARPLPCRTHGPARCGGDPLSPAALPHVVRGGGLRAPAGRDPPRPQAVERDRHRARRGGRRVDLARTDPAAQGARLRTGAHHRVRRRGHERDVRGRRDPRHAALHEPRAGARRDAIASTCAATCTRWA